MKNNSIRAATKQDAKELLEIYAPYVEKTAISFEYEVPSPEEFEQRIQNILKKYPYLVAERNGKIAGYAYAGPFKGRTAYDWAVETTVYVEQNQKRTGVGKALYEALENQLRRQNILNLYACVACTKKEDPYLTNNSVEFHRHMGYRVIGEFEKCGYKLGRWYDMVWMEKQIGNHPKQPKSVISFPNMENPI